MRCALAAAVFAAVLGAAAGSEHAPSGPFVTSINGLGVPVNNWPSSEESVSSMRLHLLTDTDPLVRLRPLHRPARTLLMRARAHPLRCARGGRPCATTVRGGGLRRQQRPRRTSEHPSAPLNA